MRSEVDRYPRPSPRLAASLRAMAERRDAEIGIGLAKQIDSTDNRLGGATQE
jgi:hypothetical protein